MSIWADQRIKELLARVALLEKRLDALENQAPVEPPPPQPEQRPILTTRRN